MSGIYQLNQATGSVTLPVSGNTFIGTSDNSELYTVDSAGNVTIYGKGSGGGGGSIDTGSFATTGSNSFVGSQVITGSLILHNNGFSSPTLNFENDGTSTPISQIEGQTYGGGIEGGLNFNYYNGGSLKEGFRLREGKIGIGTINPTVALTVSGSISSSNTIYSNNGIEITGPLNTIHTSGLLSQSIVDIIDEDLSSIFPAYNIASGSVNGFSLNSGSNSPAIFVGTTTLTNINGVTGGALNGAAISFSSGSTACSVGLQKTTGGTQLQLYYNPDYAGGNESYTVQVGDTTGGENRLVIQKADTLGEGVQLKLSDITEGFVLDHNFSNSSASLFKVRDSGSVNTIFDITETGTKSYRPLTGLTNNFTASVTGGGVYTRISGSLTCSIQPNSVVPIPTGVEFEFFQYSNHQLHFDTGSGVILNSKNGHIKLAGQFSAATLKKVATDEWDLIGDLA
jgi:hypothetical protein